MTKIERALLAAAAMAVIGIMPARADDAALAREMNDRAAIEALMWKYVRALDSFDADGYAAAFTADGQFTSGRAAEKGTAAPRARPRASRRRRPCITWCSTTRYRSSTRITPATTRIGPRCSRVPSRAS